MSTRTPAKATSPTSIEALKAALAAAGLLPLAMRPSTDEQEVTPGQRAVEEAAAAEVAKLNADAAPKIPESAETPEVDKQRSDFEAEVRERARRDAAMYTRTQAFVAEPDRIVSAAGSVKPKAANLDGMDPVARDRILANFADLVLAGREDLVPEVHLSATHDLIARLRAVRK